MSTFLGLPLPSQAETFNSQLDVSANLVAPLGPKEAFEARFVRRSSEYIVVYVSCQSACNQACRFCHLTASGQVHGRDASVEEIVSQASSVLNYYALEVQAGRQTKAPVVHFNFMARGEPFISNTVMKNSSVLFRALHDLALSFSLTPVIKLSTIGPKGFSGSIISAFNDIQPDIYYSIYSLNPVFRKKWLPNAVSPEVFLPLLASWQQQVRKLPVLHYAVIGGENDSIKDTEDIVSLVNSFSLQADVNLVRYNPPSKKHGVEASEANLKAIEDVYKAAWPNSAIKTVSRVGFDVAASCGMFLGGSTPK